MNNSVDFYGTKIAVNFESVQMNFADKTNTGVWFDVFLNGKHFAVTAQRGDDGEWEALNPAIEDHLLLRHELDNIARHANPTAKSAPMPGWWGIFAVQLEQIAKAIK